MLLMSNQNNGPNQKINTALLLQQKIDRLPVLAG